MGHLFWERLDCFSEMHFCSTAHRSSRQRTWIKSWSRNKSHPHDCVYRRNIITETSCLWLIYLKEKMEIAGNWGTFLPCMQKILYFTSTRFFLRSADLLSVNKVDKKLHTTATLLTIQMTFNCNIAQLHGYIHSENYKPRASCRIDKNQFCYYLVSYGIV